MNTSSVPILLATNGAPASLPALRYGAWLADELNSPVKLLGIQESGPWRHMLASALEGTQAELQEQGRTFEVISMHGNSEERIAEYAERGETGLLVFGPFGRPGWRRWLRGRSIRRIMQRVSSPFIYVRQAPMQLRRILVCLGGLGYSFPMLEIAIYLASATGAEMSLLHIIEPGAYEYPTARRAHAKVGDLLDSDTPQGRNLQAALEATSRAGIDSEILIRSGYTLEEISKVAASGRYDLLGLGSPYSSQSLRHLATTNITAQIAELVPVPVLVARKQAER
mgnify:CR=1 FL=1